MLACRKCSVHCIVHAFLAGDRASVLLCRYIVSAKVDDTPDDYVFVYYRGRNDAWTGYGGAVIYTRAKTLPESAIPEIKEAAQRVGLDYR
jgi:hypothetical protein